MDTEPAYAADKERVDVLLRPVGGGSFLEVGTGTGDDALALSDRFGVEVRESTARRRWSTRHVVAAR